MALFICANSSFIADVVFGSKWQGVSLVIAVLALMHGYSWVVGVNGEAYRAVGFPSYETTIMAVTLPFYIAGYWISVRHSFDAFLWTRLGLSLAAWIAHFWVAKKAVGIQIIPCIAYVLKVSAVCLPSVLVVRLINFDIPFLNGAAQMAACTIFMAGGLWLIERKGLIPELFAMAMGRIRS